MSMVVLFNLYDTLVWIDQPSLRAAREAAAGWTGLSAEALAGADRLTWDSRMTGGLGQDLDRELEAVLIAAGSPPTPPRVAALRSSELHAWGRAGRVFADVPPCLSGLRAAGVRLGLVSNCGHLTRPLLRDWGLWKRFDAVVLSCEVGCVKPDGAILRHALDRLGGAAEEAVLVDDRGANVEAARRLGLRALRIARGSGRSAGGVELADLRHLPRALSSAL